MRLHVIKQHDEKDCGAACLAMIAKYYGLSLPLSRFRELTKTDSQGANLYGLANAAAQIGFQAEALQGGIADLTQGVHNGTLSLPMIAHTVQDGLYHYVVITGISHHHVCVADPAFGKTRYTIDDFSHIWSGNIMTLVKSPSFREEKTTVGVLRRFLQLLKGQYRLIFCVFLAAVIVMGFGIVTTFSVQYVVDKALQNAESHEDHGHTEDTNEAEEDASDIQQDNSLFDRFILFVEERIQKATDSVDTHWTNISIICMAAILICLIQVVFQYIREFLLSRISRSLDIKLMIGSYAQMLHLPLSFFQTLNSGDIISRFTETAVIREAVSSVMLTIVLDSFLAVGCGILLASISLPLFFVALGTVLLSLITVLCYVRPLQRVNHAVMSSEAGVVSHLKETTECMETVKLTNAHSTVMQTASAKMMKLIQNVYHGTLLYASKCSVTGFVNNISVIVIFWIGSSLIATDSITVGILISFYMMMSFFTDPIQRLISVQQSVQSASVALERLSDIMEASVEENTAANSATENAPCFDSEIKFDGVSFRYGNRELVLQDVTLRIPCGSRVALVGESGSGKTTLARLLLRFYQPESGTVCIGSTDIREIPLSELRKEVAYLPQNPTFFSDTIRYNLNLSGNHTDEQLLRVCKACQLDSLVNCQPYGLDAVIDGGGLNLSSGQKQRLAIARALLQEPRILILDEATSNLDTITESNIRTLVEQELKGVTVIIIAHRLSTIRNCDRIFVMKEGELVEEGTHEQLIKANGCYTAYWNAM